MEYFYSIFLQLAMFMEVSQEPIRIKRINWITMNKIGERIRQARGDISQTVFSSKIGLTQITLSRYERDERSPDADTLITICNTYNISPLWLLSGIGPMLAGEQPQPAEIAPQQPEPTAKTATCARCAKIDAKMEKVEHQRDDLMQENRELNAENRHLWKENGDLRERCAKLEVR